MKDRPGDRFLPILLSVLVHAAVVGTLIWGAVMYRRPQPAASALAIEGTLVSNAPTQPAAPNTSPPDAAAAGAGAGACCRQGRRPSRARGGRAGGRGEGCGREDRGGQGGSGESQ